MSSVRIPLAAPPVRYVAVVTVAGSILIASVGQPGQATAQYGPFGIIAFDKWAHGLAYFVLTATLAYAFVAPASTDRHHRLAWSVGVAVAFGGCIELVQWPISYRTASGIDAGVNAIGACLLAIIWWWLLDAVRFA